MAARAGVKEATAAQMSASPAAAADDVWSRLPGDLLGVVYARIHWPLDRVRFAAVCKSWRHILSWPPAQPALPWLIHSPYRVGTAERVFCPVDGSVLRVPFPAQAIGKRLVGSHDGGWIIAAPVGDADASLVIVNLFTGVKVPLSAEQQRILDAPGCPTPDIRKIILSEDPTSKHCILAAIFTNNAMVGLCRVACRRRWWMSKEWSEFLDIAFCRGKLYGLDQRCDIFMFDIGMTKTGKSVVSATCLLHIQKPCSRCSWRYPTFNYIFKHDDKLFMARRTKWSQEHEHSFKVFELIKIDNDKTTKYDYKWVEVITLDNHALFLSVPYSKLMHVPAGRHGDVERNHIYYNHPRTSEEFIADVVQLKICDNGDHMHCTEDQRINGVDSITSLRYYMANGCHTVMWILPPNF